MYVCFDVCVCVCVCVCMPACVHICQSASSQVLQAKLDAMLVEQRKRDAATMRSVNFRGSTVAVKEESVSVLGDIFRRRCYLSACHLDILRYLRFRSVSSCSKRKI